MNEDFTDDLKRTQERIRSRKVNDTEYTIQCRDPYGFWYVVGKTPKVLNQAFTTADLAWQNIENYERNRPTPRNTTIVSTDGKGNKTRVKIKDLLDND